MAKRLKRLLITSGAHCLHKDLWLPILLICFYNMFFILNLGIPLHTPSDGFSPQEVRILIFTDNQTIPQDVSAFLHQGNTILPFFNPIFSPGGAVTLLYLPVACF